MFRTLVLWINSIFLSFALLTIDAPSAGASTGATFTVNPDQRVSVLILDDGARVTMNANSNTFSVISPYGQTYTFSFVQIAQELAGTPSEQQALIQQWQTALNDLSNRFTFTNSHEPDFVGPSRFLGSAPRAL